MIFIKKKIEMLVCYIVVLLNITRNMNYSNQTNKYKFPIFHTIYYIYFFYIQNQARVGAITGAAEAAAVEAAPPNNDKNPVEPLESCSSRNKSSGALNAP